MKAGELHRRMDALREQQLEHIQRHGRTLVGVFALQDSKDPINDAFTYTIGNALKQLPELLIVGLYDDRGILNALSEEMIRRGRAFDDGDTFTFPGSSKPVALCDAAESVKERYTLQATDILGGADKYRVMQVVLCDKAGLFPWTPGCAEPYSKVVVRRAKTLN